MTSWLLFKIKFKGNFVKKMCFDLIKITLLNFSMENIWFFIELMQVFCTWLWYRFSAKKNYRVYVWFQFDFYQFDPQRNLNAQGLMINFTPFEYRLPSIFEEVNCNIRSVKGKSRFVNCVRDCSTEIGCE